MDKGAPPPSLFVNDGSFMERFKQLRGEEEKVGEKDKKASEKDSNPKPVISGKPLVSKTGFQLKTNSKIGSSTPVSGGKLAFCLKQKSKLVAPAVRLGGDDDEESNEEVGNVSGDGVSVKRQKFALEDDSLQMMRQADFAPPPPSDPTVKNVAEKLASFVAKNGRQFENITRQKNPGDTPFKFLFDKNCPEYKFYEHKLSEEEKSLSQEKESQILSAGSTNSSASKLVGTQQISRQSLPNYHTPASALYDSVDDATSRAGEQNGPSSSDSLAMMEFYMKKAAQEERKRPLKQSNDEMPPPASLQMACMNPANRGHHMGDYIPPEELEKFLASCNDAVALKAAKESAEKAKIQADNVGHKLLSKMGWREGEGLGSSGSGISDPIMAGNVKQDHLGVGAQQPGEVTPEDDIYEQYKKRMMLGYRHRPNPLNNPRKAYY